MSISKIFDLFKSIFVYFADKIKSFFKDKLGIYKDSNFFYIGANTMAKAIDAIILIGNAIKAAIKKAAVKSVCAAAVKCFKNHPEKFTKFLKEKGYEFLKDHLPNIVNPTIKTVAGMIGLNITSQVTKQKVKDAIFNRFSVYRWINALTSPGTIIAVLFDMLDGNWNDSIRIQYR